MADLDERLAETMVRCAARAMSTAVLLLILAFAIGEEVPNPVTLSLQENLLFAAMLTMMTGLVVAWKREGTGGLLILGGWAFFAVVNQGIPLNVVFGPILLAGLLFLLCWWRTRRMVRLGKRS